MPPCWQVLLSLLFAFQGPLSLFAQKTITGSSHNPPLVETIQGAVARLQQLGDLDGSCRRASFRLNATCQVYLAEFVFSLLNDRESRDPERQNTSTVDDVAAQEELCCSLAHLKRCLQAQCAAPELVHFQDPAYFETIFKAPFDVNRTCNASLGAGWSEHQCRSAATVLMMILSAIGFVFFVTCTIVALGCMLC